MLAVRSKFGSCLTVDDLKRFAVHFPNFKPLWHTPMNGTQQCLNRSISRFEVHLFTTRNPIKNIDCSINSAHKSEAAGWFVVHTMNFVRNVNIYNPIRQCALPVWRFQIANVSRQSSVASKQSGKEPSGAPQLLHPNFVPPSLWRAPLPVSPDHRRAFPAHSPA